MVSFPDSRVDSSGASEPCQKLRVLVEADVKRSIISTAAVAVVAGIVAVG